VLVALKWLRGKPLDIFGYARLRHVEPALIGEYCDRVELALSSLEPATYELADLPDLIRGYDQIKLRSVKRFRAAARELLKA
jgi:indolepyruvate ferredoxin oxidoreductase